MSRRQLLQDEAAKISTEIESLRALSPATAEETATVEQRLADLASRADEIAPKLAAENALDAKLLALRQGITSTSEARASVVTGDEEGRGSPLPIFGSTRGFRTAEIAAKVGTYLRGLVTGEIRAMGETTPTYDAKGVEFVLKELYGNIVNRLSYQSVALQLASVYRPNGQTIALPKVGEITAAWVGEGVASTDQDLATSSTDLTLSESRVSVPLSRSLLEDSPIDIAGVLAERFALAYAKFIDSNWLAGNGSAPAITGLAASVAGGNTITVAANASTTAANLADVVGKVDETVMNTAWVVSRAGWTDFMKIWQAQQTTQVVGGGRVVPTVHGVPVYLVKGLPATTLGLYGDFSMASAVAVKASGLEIEVARELLIRNRQVLYVGNMRIGIANHDAQFVGRLAKAAS